MKTFFILLAMTTSLSASAFCNREAQFIGTVTNLEVVAAPNSEAEMYSFQVKLGFENRYLFNPSTLCPMWEDELESAVLYTTSNRNLKSGSSISGVMVFDEENQKYRIE